MKDGDYYDRCPQDGCLEVDAAHRSEGSLAGPREAWHDWSIFNADRRAGGCGATWTRTTTTGARKDRARGIEPLNLTASAGKERSISVPSQAYRDHYDMAFRKGAYAPRPDECSPTGSPTPCDVGSDTAVGSTGGRP